MELGDHLRLALHQFGVQHVAEQVVVPVPNPDPVERDHEQVGPLHPVQYPAGSLASHDDIAQRSRKSIEDRGASQERHVPARHSIEELGPQIVTHEPVGAGEGEPDIGVQAAGIHGEGREVQTGGPTLGALDQVLHGLRGEVDPRFAQQPTCLRDVHSEIVGPDLDDAAFGAKPRDRHRYLVPGAHRHLRTTRQPQGQFRDHVPAFGVRERFDLIEHQRNRPPRCRDRGSQPSHVGNTSPERCQGPRHAGFDPLDAVQRDR